MRPLSLLKCEDNSSGNKNKNKYPQKHAKKIKKTEIKEKEKKYLESLEKTLKSWNQLQQIYNDYEIQKPHKKNILQAVDN